jgi:hypothetical protein
MQLLLVAVAQELLLILVVLTAVLEVLAEALHLDLCLNQPLTM